MSRQLLVGLIPALIKHLVLSWRNTNKELPQTYTDTEFFNEYLSNAITHCFDTVEKIEFNFNVIDKANKEIFQLQLNCKHYLMTENTCVCCGLKINKTNSDKEV